MRDYKKRYNELSKKEQDSYNDMKIVQEMYARGFEFMPIDIFRAKANHFQVVDGKLMPALSTIDGMGGKAAEGVVEAAKHGPFSSRENFKLRAKISGTVVEKMAEMGILGDLPETDQMSLLDFVAVIFTVIKNVFYKRVLVLHGRLKFALYIECAAEILDTENTSVSYRRTSIIHVSQNSFTKYQYYSSENIIKV